MKHLKKLMIIMTLIIALSSSVFCYTVEAAATKTELQTAYDSTNIAISTQEASPVGDPYYEANSYQAFMDAIDLLGGVIGIQAVIDDPLAEQTEVDDLSADINLALSGLITDDTYYSVLLEFSTANSIDLTPYTSNSQVDYNTELDRIEVILNNPNSGEVMIQSLSQEITSSSDLLVLRGDKTSILTLISQIDILYVSDGLIYTPSSFNRFKTSYDNIDTLLTADVGMTLQEIVDDIDALVHEVASAEARLNETLNLLALRPNKTQLISDYNNALNIDASIYTASSYLSFTDGLNLINHVITDLEALEPAVNQALIDLADLYNLLVLKGDTTDLQASFDIQNSLDLAAYTPNSIDLFEQELDRIETILLSNDITQMDADTALIDLNSAHSMLILIADKTNLDLLNQLLIKAYYEESQLYTKSSHDRFKVSCNLFGSYLYINSVIVDDNASSLLVETLELNIQNALKELVLLADNSGLLLVYYDLINVDISSNTENSQTAYLEELDRIYNIVIGDELDNSAVQQILIDLSVIDELLIELSDYSELQALFDTIDIYREEDYSASSYGILNSAIIYSTYMLGNANATQEELNQAIVSLQSAIDGLDQTIETLYLQENDTLDITEYITMGNDTIQSYEITDETIISVDPNGIVTGLGYGKTIIKIILSSGIEENIEISVNAGITTPVYVMLISMPIATSIFSLLVIYTRKDTWIKLFTSFKKIFKKKLK